MGANCCAAHRCSVHCFAIALLVFPIPGLFALAPLVSAEIGIEFYWYFLPLFICKNRRYSSGLDSFIIAWLVKITVSTAMCTIMTHGNSFRENMISIGSGINKIFSFVCLESGEVGMRPNVNSPAIQLSRSVVPSHTPSYFENFDYRLELWFAWVATSEELLSDLDYHPQMDYIPLTELSLEPCWQLVAQLDPKKCPTKQHNFTRTSKEKHNRFDCLVIKIEYERYCQKQNQITQSANKNHNSQLHLSIRSQP